MTLDEEGGNNFFRQVWSLWVTPEILRRKEKNRLPIDFAVDKVQILISPEERPPIVRLNEEVIANLICKFKSGIRKQVIGEPVFWKEKRTFLISNCLNTITQTLHTSLWFFSERVGR